MDGFNHSLTPFIARQRLMRDIDMFRLFNTAVSDLRNVFVKFQQVWS